MKFRLLNENKENWLDYGDFEEVRSKSVPDSDGFMTDYTWYRTKDGLNVFVFGDKDLYDPNNTDWDWETEDDQAAQEWFNNYDSLNEDLIIRNEYETDLTDFEFWYGGKDTVKDLTEDEIRTISQYLEDVYPDGMTETDVNDFFWFERDTIADILGYDSYEEIMNRN